MTLDTFLNARQIETLRAAVNRIIPADDYPNGWEAGVGSYLAALFAREPRFVPVYQSGLDEMDAQAQAVAGSGLADLTAAQQDVFLTQIEASSFFGLLVQQCMEGFYADPGNGGNINGIAWDMIGYKVTA